MRYYVEIYTVCPKTLTTGYKIEILEFRVDSEEEARTMAKMHPLFDSILSSGPIFDI